MFRFDQAEPLSLERSGPLAAMYTLSPFVWRQGRGFQVLLRAVNHAEKQSDKIARVYAGTSTDGLHFVMQDTPVLAPGPDEADRDGVEDPTVITLDGRLYAYYSGWNEKRKQGQLMLATGPDPDCLDKQGLALTFSERYQNPKEAAVAVCPDGTWRLFFEYSRDGASLIGLASGPSVTGPWTIGDDPFAPRAGSWDSWNLSPGPILLSDSDRPVLFYNGSPREPAWRVGWAAFNADFTQVIARSDEPLFMPPPPQPGYRDIAFASSAVEADGAIWLYYSLYDKDPMRGIVRMVA